MSSFVYPANEDSFEEAVLAKSHEVPVVVDFWAPWCGPCLQLGPVLEELAQAAGGAWLLAKVNSDENPTLSQVWRVQGIPQVIAFVDGEAVDQFTGALPKPAIEAFLKKLVPSRAERLAREAAAAQKDGDKDRELDLWSQVLESDPEFHVARIRRARILLGRGNLSGARDDLDRVPEESPLREDADKLLQLADWAVRVSERGGMDAIRDRAAEDPDTVRHRFDYGCALALEGNFRDALAEFLEVVRRDRSFEEDAGREAMLALFSFLGDRHELTNEFRAQLGRVLF